MILANMDQVAGFSRVFRGDSGLRRLTVKGLKHEETLQQLKSELLRDGGVFEVVT